MAFQNYQIAAGWNAAGSLANIETAFPKYQNKPLIVRARRFNEGIKRIRGDKQRSTSGFQSFVWFCKVLSVAQWNYFQDNYSSGGSSYSGKVTVRTRKSDDTYANFNAVMHLPDPSEMDSSLIGDAYRNVEIRFVVEAAL